MILTGPEIKRRREMGYIKIDPFNEKQLNPNSYNLTLHSEMLTYRAALGEHLDARKDNPTWVMSIPEEGLIFRPGRLYLARTNELTETHGLVPQLDGRSSVGRLGVSVHATAGFGDMGFVGCWTLEISVIEPVKLYPGMEICQVSYHEVIGEHRPYKGKYQDSGNVQASKLYQEFG